MDQFYRWIWERWALWMALTVVTVLCAAAQLRTRRGVPVGFLALRGLVWVAGWVARWCQCLYLALDSFAVRWVRERREPLPESEIARVIRKEVVYGAAASRVLQGVADANDAMRQLPLATIAQERLQGAQDAGDPG